MTQTKKIELFRTSEFTTDGRLIEYESVKLPDGSIPLLKVGGELCGKINDISYVEGVAMGLVTWNDTVDEPAAVTVDVAGSSVREEFGMTVVSGGRLIAGHVSSRDHYPWR